ncbi:flagellar biosynthesis protein FliP [Defluviimonas sp. 20V17]|uniref:Flagellar biosynthetic protein FliP n=1 Tax=Allgaiera indica TaxID=765699 RepID=A0AAN4ZX03_9RHOB|nr:flagellar type III secretion system pore protein FliP [Allgaiera indica]KDB03497.1 flagellar biosynthesis protein FliP [Defluviimonas sp. 20V17]GHD98100.1 flagellar biosynthetic protein FliP [Allgaiera indica]SDW53917.1 flagellar biosynthetic protein FliP [Allgaiera indica]
MQGATSPLVSVTTQGHGQVFSLDIQTLLIITLLAFLPGLVLLMTSFTRFIVVLAIFRQALGLTTTPPNILLIALALILSAFVMRPTLETVNNAALQPYLARKISFDDATKAAIAPMRAFMLKQVRERELHLFVNLSGHKGEYANLDDVPLLTLVPAFVTSELQSAFQIGFLIYIPFALIDLAVAAILMALGMIMVSPTLISLPIKLLLFVSIGGWSLLLGSVARSVVH